ncbi:MAG: glycosyltransferase [Thermodesulfobacteriota bacterium]
MKNSLKVAIAVPKFPNPVQPYIFNQILFLKKRGFLANIIANTGKNEYYGHEANIRRLIDDTIYVNLDGCRNCLKEIFPGFFNNSSLLSGLKKWPGLIKSKNWQRYGVKYFVKELLRVKVLSVSRFDIIHSHSVFTSYDYLFLKEVYGIPLITTFHGLQPNNVKPLDGLKFQSLLAVGDIFLVNTEFAKAQLVSLGCRGEKVVILPQGTDTKKFIFKGRKLPVNGKIILLTVARLSPEKGINDAVEAVSKISAHMQVEYRIVGEGPQRPDLEKLVGDLGIGSTVRFLGAMGQEQLVDQYNEAHILLVPSIRIPNGLEETQGVVIQEAQATGLPVIATRIGGIPECIVDGRTGLLVEEKKPEDLANKIDFLIKNPDKYRELSHAGWRDVEERFDIEKIGERLLKIYEDVFTRSRREQAAEPLKSL